MYSEVVARLFIVLKNLYIFTSLFVVSVWNTITIVFQSKILVKVETTRKGHETPESPIFLKFKCAKKIVAITLPSIFSKFDHPTVLSSYNKDDVD